MRFEDIGNKIFNCRKVATEGRELYPSPPITSLDQKDPQTDLKMRRSGDLSISQNNWPFKISYYLTVTIKKNYPVNNHILTGTFSRPKRLTLLLINKNNDANDFEDSSKSN